MPHHTLDGYTDSNYILNLNKKNLSELSRISTIEELIFVSEGRSGELAIKVLNDDTIIAAGFILENIKSILGLDPNNIKDHKIAPIVKKIGNELFEKGDCKNSVVGLFIQNIALEIANIHLRLERRKNNNKSLTDSLTGLSNRLMLDTEIEKQIELKNRNDTVFSILLIDIDYFKKINDTYGHLVGDDVLKKLANILKNSFRQNDIIGRRGGEEFMIILPSTNVIIAAKKANEIRRIIEETLSLIIDKIEGQITVSIGVTQIEEKGIDGEKLIKNADIALYKCKSGGKNQVQVQLNSTGLACTSACDICPKKIVCTKKDKRI